MYLLMGDGIFGDFGWASRVCWISCGEVVRGDGVFCISSMIVVWSGWGVRGEWIVGIGGMGGGGCWGGGVGVEGLVMMVGFCLMKLVRVLELFGCLGGGGFFFEGGVCWKFCVCWVIGVDWLLRWIFFRMWFRVCWRICNCCFLLRSKVCIKCKLKYNIVKIRVIFIYY